VLTLGAPDQDRPIQLHLICAGLNVGDLLVLLSRLDSRTRPFDCMVRAWFVTALTFVTCLRPRMRTSRASILWVVVNPKSRRA
jgi:hypothetical protein